MDLHKLSNKELIDMYSCLIKELKSRQIIRSNNLIGDFGEFIAIDYYNKTTGLPKLQSAPPNTQNIDAISTKGERYSIKTTTTNTTGVFYGLNPKGSIEVDSQKFEYVIIVILDKNFVLQRIIELTWEQLQRYKRWHSRMNAWNLTITQNLLSNTKTIYKN